MASTGWIKLHRSINDWGWNREPNVVALWLHLLLNANFEDGYFMGFEIKKGSLATGLNSLSLKTGLSQQQIRTALNKLKSTNEITIKTTNKFSIISIVKWNDYQDDNKQNNKPITNHQQTDNKRITTIKESKKLRTKEDINNKPTLPQTELLFKVAGGELVNFDNLFERLWDLYPSIRSKGKKADAKKHFEAKIEAGVDYEVIGRGVAKYKSYCEHTGEKNKDMFRWLRDDLYNEQYPISHNYKPNQQSGGLNGKDRIARETADLLEQIRQREGD